MKKIILLKIICYFFLMPWRLMPTRYKCECGMSVFFKQEYCGKCRDVLNWDNVKEYEHF